MDDDPSNQMLSKDEFFDLMHDYTTAYTDEDLEQIFSECDVNNTGTVRMIEVVKHIQAAAAAGAEDDYSDEEDIDEMYANHSERGHRRNISNASSMAGLTLHMGDQDVGARINGIPLSVMEIKEMQLWVEDVGKPAVEECDELRYVVESRIPDLEKKIFELEMQLTKEQQRNRMLSDDNKKVENDLKALRKQTESHTMNLQELEKLKTMKKSAEDDTVRYRRQWDEERSQNKRLREENTDLLSNIREINYDKERLASMFREEEMKRQNLEGINEELHLKIRDIMQEHDSRNKKSRDEMLDRENGLVAQINSLNSEVMELRTRDTTSTPRVHSNPVNQPVGSGVSLAASFAPATSSQEVEDLLAQIQALQEQNQSLSRMLTSKKTQEEDLQKRRRELTEGEEALERKKQEHDMAMEKLLQEVSFTEKLKQTLTENRSELLGQQNDLEVERMALKALKESVQQQQASLQEEKQQATSDRLEIESTITDLKSRRTKLALDEDRFKEETKLLNIDKENLRREQTEFTSEKQQLNILKDFIEAQRRQLKQQKAKLKESKRQPESPKGDDEGKQIVINHKMEDRKSFSLEGDKRTVNTAETVVSQKDFMQKLRERLHVIFFEYGSKNNRRQGLKIAEFENALKSSGLKITDYDLVAVFKDVADRNHLCQADALFKELKRNIDLQLSEDHILRNAIMRRWQSARIKGGTKGRQSKKKTFELRINTNQPGSGVAAARTPGYFAAKNSASPNTPLDAFGTPNARHAVAQTPPIPAVTGKVKRSSKGPKSPDARRTLPRMHTSPNPRQQQQQHPAQVAGLPPQVAGEPVPARRSRKPGTKKNRTRSMGAVHSSHQRTRSKELLSANAYPKQSLQAYGSAENVHINQSARQEYYDYKRKSEPVIHKRGVSDARIRYQGHSPGTGNPSKRFAGGVQRHSAQASARAVPAAHAERRRKRTAERASATGVGARMRRTPSGSGRQLQ